MKNRLLFIVIAGALLIGAVQVVLATSPHLLPGFEEPEPLQFDRSRMVKPEGRATQPN